MHGQLGAFEDGKLLGVSGAYPFTYHIGGESIKVMGSGNVAVSGDARGKGVMSAILKKLYEETKDISDVSYLHGSRARYKIFGYYPCGTQYVLNIEERMLSSVLSVKYEFSDMRYIKNEAIIKACYDISNSWDNFVERKYEDFLLAVQSLGRVPFAILDENKNPVGYFSYDGPGAIVEEFALSSKDNAPQIFKAFIKYMQKPVLVRLPDFDCDFTSKMLDIAESYTISCPAQFRITNFENIIRALLKVKVQNYDLPEGEVVICSDLLDGAVKISYKNKEVKVTKSEEEEGIRLDGEALYDYLFAVHRRKLYKNAGDVWFPLALYIPYFS